MSTPVEKCSQWVENKRNPREDGRVLNPFTGNWILLKSGKAVDTKCTEIMTKYQAEQRQKSPVRSRSASPVRERPEVPAEGESTTPPGSPRKVKRTAYEKIVDEIERANETETRINWLKIFKYLNKVDINETVSDIDDTLLMFALSTNEVGVSKSLLKRGADPNKRNLENNNSFAFAYDNLDLTKLLLKTGADVNMGFGKNISYPLTLAAKAGDIMMVKMLLKAGADKTLKDYKGRTPYDIAKEYEREDVLKYLKLDE